MTDAHACLKAGAAIAGAAMIPSAWTKFKSREDLQSHEVDSDPLIAVQARTEHSGHGRSRKRVDSGKMPSSDMVFDTTSSYI